MKDILKSALGAVIGIITLNIILGVFIILIISVAAAGSASANGEKGVKNKGSKDHQVIHLTFSDVPDRSPSGFADLDIFNLSPPVSNLKPFKGCVLARIPIVYVPDDG